MLSEIKCVYDALTELEAQINKYKDEIHELKGENQELRSKLNKFHELLKQVD